MRSTILPVASTTDNTSEFIMNVDGVTKRQLMSTLPIPTLIQAALDAKKLVKTIFSGATGFTADVTRYATQQGSVYTASGTQKIFIERDCVIKNLVVKGQGNNSCTLNVTIMYGVNAVGASSASAVTTGVITFTSTTANYGADLTNTITAVAGSWIEFRLVSANNPGTVVIECEMHY